MNLVIDIGNSASKLAVFKDNKLLESLLADQIGKRELDSMITRYPGIEKGILSSVRKNESGLMAFLKEQAGFFLYLDHRTPLPIKNLYGSKTTLGYDRIAAAVGANFLFRDKDLLIIDMGTAITIDIVSADNAFRGGNISPGSAMRFRALHEFTDNLPLVKDKPRTAYPGVDTEGAIASGVQDGIVFELDGYINTLKIRYPELKVVMTGGDANVFAGKLKNSIFVDSNLNLLGLHRILEFNAER